MCQKDSQGSDLIKMTISWRLPFHLGRRLSPLQNLFLICAIFVTIANGAKVRKLYFLNNVYFLDGCCILCIQTSRWVLFMPFLGPNHIFWHFNIFYHHKRQKVKKRKKERKIQKTERDRCYITQIRNRPRATQQGGVN